MDFVRPGDILLPKALVSWAIRKYPDIGLLPKSVTKVGAIGFNRDWLMQQIYFLVEYVWIINHDHIINHNIYIYYTILYYTITILYYTIYICISFSNHYIDQLVWDGLGYFCPWLSWLRCFVEAQVVKDSYAKALDACLKWTMVKSVTVENGTGFCGKHVMYPLVNIPKNYWT